MKNALEKGRQHTTAQRALLLELIREAEGHVDADELYRQARQRQPGLSLSTVYRSLRLFKQLGLVEQHQLDGARRHYEARPETSHHHLICLGCGRIREFQCPSTERLKARIGKEEGFEVTEADVRLAGYCPECREHLKSSERDPEQQIPEGGEQDAVWKRLGWLGRRLGEG